ncbi:monothiol glutaredoxin-S9-like [Musa acuminata AAA Group]
MRTAPLFFNTDTILGSLLSAVFVRRGWWIIMMQQAIPYSSGKAWPSLSRAPEAWELKKIIGGAGEIRVAVEENPVVVVGRSGCFMVHVVRRLLLGQGVNPVVCEVGEDADEAAIMASLPPEAHDERRTSAATVTLPAVFVGGRLVGGLDRLMAVHISGELVPILKRAGALWL